MIEERLEEFNKNVLVINEKYSEYVNEEKGLRYPFNTPQLLCRVDKLELDKNELAVAKFKQQIEWKDYKLVDIIKHVSKYEITKVEADRYTITDKKTKGVILYNVSNQIGIHNTYDNQKEAFELCNKINEHVFTYMGVDSKVESI